MYQAFGKQPKETSMADDLELSIQQTWIDIIFLYNGQVCEAHTHICGPLDESCLGGSSSLAQELHIHRTTKLHN